MCFITIPFSFIKRIIGISEDSVTFALKTVRLTYKQDSERVLFLHKFGRLNDKI